MIDAWSDARWSRCGLRGWQSPWRPPPLLACSGGEDASPRDAGREASPPASATPIAERSLLQDLDALANLAPSFDPARIRRVGEAGDIRLAWMIADMMRFVAPGASDTHLALVTAFSRLTGQPEGAVGFWVDASNYLLANDVPAPDGYREWKGALYTRFDEEWAPFFGDADAEVDWRLISWGGVFIDSRPITAFEERPIEEGVDFCGCIPALNDPAVTDAGGGDWYPDDRLVFGVELNGEARAYPRHQMQVHEMVNDTLGGRRIGLVYCTLCGTAQAFLTDTLPEGVVTPTGTLELRTSGLLARSNKVMFDLHTFSFFDTFRGRAISGPLQDAGLELEQLTVAVATWGEWKAGHPGTTIVAEDGGIGRHYPFDPLGGRDDDWADLPGGRGGPAPAGAGPGPRRPDGRRDGRVPRGSRAGGAGAGPARRARGRHGAARRGRARRLRWRRRADRDAPVLLVRLEPVLPGDGGVVRERVSRVGGVGRAGC